MDIMRYCEYSFHASFNDKRIPRF